MPVRLEPMRVGQLELLVETVPVGSEPTGRAAEAGARVLDAFERVKDAIVEVAASTVEVIGRTAARAARPDHLEVQFGLKVAASGNVIVAGASAEASVLVKLVYDAGPGAVQTDQAKGDGG